ncbi:hypothetical protein AXG93_4368s1080 [Marchantia polymorpha subsp. ruderalis]|uniref:Ribosomal RNA-processing protein 40 n=1 Tax=Marchantia polymorpha subsp. ruderalis TaxID=1480154 RepID=A0A176VXW7_MARPO|nr:hypothetical protein AXG93_4368s1080 [Marchantia polymorpha subsp. ruderalis]
MEVQERVQAAALSPLLNQIVAPGDVVLDLTKAGKVVRLGGGLRQDGDSIVVTRAGRLRHTKPNKYWVEGSQKRYVPNLEDGVIGIVTDRRFEAFSLDIGAPTFATLPILAFEGATRRNAPNLQAVSNKSSGFGPLKNGYIFDCSTGLARSLLSKPMCPVLEALGKRLSYEIAVGLNGRVWVNAEEPSTIVAVSNAILAAEFLTPAQQHIMVARIMETMQ